MANPTLDYMARAASQLPDDFGDGWMTANARDLMRIGLIAGCDPQTFGRRLALAGTPGRKVNAATVERVIAEMCE